jgi:hypothetical protein
MRRPGEWPPKGRAGASVKYADLAKRLIDMGLLETDGSVQVKINRSPFPAWFLLAVMRAVGAHTLRLE